MKLKMAIALSLLSAACGQMSPTSPSVDMVQEPAASETRPVNTPARAEAEVPAADPYALSTYQKDSSQYNMTFTITNGSDVELNYLLAVYDTPYANGHPRFLESQKIFSLQDVVVGPRSTRTVSGQMPQDCDALSQGDVYVRVTAAQVKSGQVDIHPAAKPKVHEVIWKFGKSRKSCEPPSALPSCATDPSLCPLLPPPPPPPSPCETVNRPRASIAAWPVDVNGTLGGSVTVRNAGAWRIRLLSASSLAKFQANTPDHEKDFRAASLLCGGTATASVSYRWTGHPDEYWWIEVRLNGAFFSKSTVTNNSHN